MAHTQFSVQQICNLLWSLAIAELCDRAIWDSCMQQVGQGVAANWTGDSPALQGNTYRQPACAGWHASRAASPGCSRCLQLANLETSYRDLPAEALTQV
jgi:hypothetical protein